MRREEGILELIILYIIRNTLIFIGIGYEIEYIISMGFCLFRALNMKQCINLIS